MRKKISVIAIVFSIILVCLIASVSYAFFTANVINNETVNNSIVTTGSMAIEFSDGPQVGLENALPGSYIEKNFKVKNVGNLNTTYDIYLSDLRNTFEDKGDLVYTLISTDGEINILERQIPSASSKIVNQRSISPNEEHNYTLKIEFKETNDNQDDNKGKIFSTIIRINEVKAPIEDSVVGILMTKNYSNEDNKDTITVEDMSYDVHVYHYDGNQVWSTSTVPHNGVFGDSEDVASGTTNATMAKRMVAVVINGDLTIEEGVKIGPYYNNYGGPKGFSLIVNGNLINNGTIDNSHGAFAEGEKVYLWRNLEYDNDENKYEFIPVNGGTGGAKVSCKGTRGKVNGQAGKSSVLNRGTGGGGSGGGAARWSSDSVTSGAGAAGTSYSGGAGGGGASSYDGKSRIGGDAKSFGGAGGAGVSNISSVGGGAGNPAGSGAASGNNGTGGLLIIYGDSITNEVNGNIKAIGANGGLPTFGVKSNVCSDNGGVGGSSGGGSINIFYNNKYINKNTTSNGGISADGGKAYMPQCTDTIGGPGGKGTITIGSVASGTFVKDN